MNNGNTAINLSNLLEQIRKLIEGDSQSRERKLQHICDLLATEISEFDWVGFYLANPHAERELVLGPFNGEPTEHTRIPFGKGICGQSADTHRTFVVQDVSKADNYISCSIDVQAEIVVPVMREDEFVAQIDIDSHQKDSITPEHRELLENICDIVAKLF